MIWCDLLQATPLKFRGSYSLRVRRAQEPSEIIWENLETSTESRLWRQAFTFGIMFILLIGSVISLSFAQVHQVNCATVKEH